MDWHVTLTALLHFRLFSISGTDTTVGSALAIVAVLTVTWLLARRMRRVVAHNFRRRGVDDDLAEAAMTKVLQGVVWLIGIEVGLNVLGVSLATLFAAAGFLALGASFALRGLTENCLSGLILRLEQTVRPEDVIVLDGRWVQIKRIGLRATDAVTYKNEEVMIPNRLIANAAVTNLTRRDSQFRLEATVGVACGSDLELVRRTLEATVNDLKWRSEEPAPAVYLRSFGPSGVNYTVHLWIDDVRDTLRPESDLHEAIWQALKGAGIKVASP